MFKLSIIDGFFDIWTKNGLVTLKDLYIDDHFASFVQLRLKFEIPNLHFFKYLQLRSFLSSQCPFFCVLTEKICYATRGCALKFYTIWQPVLDHVEKIDASDISNV